MNFFLKLSFALLLMAAVSPAATGTDLNGVKWITVAGEASSTPNRWICFRKTFEAGRPGKEAVLDIAVDSKYWLWVNGRMVVFEGGLKRGPNPQDTYYDTVDIAPYLKNGGNTVAILVWYWGKEGYCHKSSGKAGLLARLTLGKKVFGTDDTWRVTLHPAYGESGPPYPNYRLPESNIHFDARNDMEGWQMPGYDDTGWNTAVVAGIYPCEPWNTLHKRPTPNWRDSGIVEYENVTQQVVDGKLVVTGKLPRNISITPYMKIHSAAGGFIDIRSDNYKGGSEYNVRAEYVAKAGEQEFEAFNYINGHSVIYTLPADVEVLKVGYRETRYDTDHVGSFECSDEFYNRLWVKALNTMNMNMRDAIQDPDRERSQWWGDAVIVSGEILYSCDRNGHRLIDKAIRNLVDWQKPDGVLYSPVPAGSWEQELPAQMLASIGKFGFWNYYLYSGDKDIMEYVYPRVKKYLSLWSLDTDGLVVHRPGGWDWLDWGNNIDARVLDNAWYSLALESASDMASLLGYRDEAESYDKLRRTVKDAVNASFWNGREYRDPAYEGNTDDRGNGLAVLAGFADGEKWASIRHFLDGYANASPYMEKYVLESYFVRGDADGGLARMKRRYRYMVDHELSTLWEDWQIGGAGGGSINHGWAGGPLTLLSQYVAGVAPLEPGWNTYMIKPQLGQLEWVKCTVPAGDAIISVEIDKRRNGMGMVVNTTSDNVYTVAVAAGENASFAEVNGVKYPVSELSGAKIKDVAFQKTEAGRIYFTTRLKNLQINID